MPDDDFLGFVASRDSLDAYWVAIDAERVVGHIALYRLVSRSDLGDR